jgi:hypothetical protein
MIPEHNNKVKYKIPLGILGFIGAGIIFYLVSLHGAGTSPDSVYYISVARHISNGAGFIGYDGYYYVLQPPLYPLLLAAIKLVLHIDPLLSTGYFNSILFGLIVFLTGLLLLKHLNSYVLVLLGTVSVLISFVFIQISLMALSEPLFILLVLLHFYYFERYKDNGNKFSLILMSITIALACLTRYIGVILILTGVIDITFQKDKLSKIKFRDIVIFMFITCIPIGLWIIRNFSLSGTFVGQRADSSYTLSENINFSSNTFFQWYLPVQITILQLIFAAMAIIVLLGTALIKWKENTLIVLRKISPYLIFILFYSAIIIISSTTTAYDHIANRLLAPVYVPILIILLYMCDKIIERLSKYFDRNLITTIFAAGLLTWMIIYPVWKTIYIINNYIELSGFGYNNNNWNNKGTIKYLINNKILRDNYTFYSNAPEAVYILTSIETQWSPAKTLYNSPQLINTNPGLNDIWKDNNKVCLVWFNQIDRHFLYSVDELQKFTNMKKVAQFEDGAIYTIGNR